MAALLGSLRFREERMREAASDGFLLATDLAEHLVAAGVPFRQAHEITGRIVAHCLERGISPTDLTDDELRTFSAAFGPDVRRLLTADRSVSRRKSSGGTAGSNLTRRLASLRRARERRPREKAP
jgi:argininosuccinate lyase